MEFTAELTLRTKRALTEDDLFDAAAIGGVAVGRPGERWLDITFTVTGRNVAEAMSQVIKTAAGIDGTIEALEVMTTAEADRRSEERVQLAGVAEVAKILDVTKQRASALSKRDDFPAPIARLSTGPVWRQGDLSTFAMGWQRKPGRPRKAVGA